MPNFIKYFLTLLVLSMAFYAHAQRYFKSFPTSQQPDTFQILALKKVPSNLCQNELPKFTQLKRLEIISSKLEKVPLEICSLSNLTHLNLGNNDIDSIPKCLCELSNLEVLELWDNNIYFLPECLETMPSLKVIDLRGMKFSVREYRDLQARYESKKIRLSEPCDCEPE